MSASNELRAILLRALRLGLALPTLAACSQTVNATDGNVDDAVIDTPTDTPVTDVSDVTDARDDRADVYDASVDVGFDAQPDTGVDVVLDAGSDAGPLCSFGPPSRECLTLAQAEARIRNPPGKVIPRDAGADAAIDVPTTASGCYVASAITNDCCNRAVAVERAGETCCYTFCTGACCGRPFEVEGAARVASLDVCADWCDARGETAPRLDARTREALASAWRRDALMEHAAIASFARFTLHLMAHGAPPELLAEVQRASLDEVDHARLCFALATRLDGRALGPGSLDVSGALVATSLAECVRAAVIEGCVGETCAAFVAQTRRDGATAPEARDALDRIASDESRHAALAWRFVAWAVARGDRDVRDAAERAFREATASVATGAAIPDGVDASAWRAFGMLSASEERDAMRATIREVIAPCVRALFASHATSGVKAPSRGATPPSQVI